MPAIRSLLNLRFEDSFIEQSFYHSYHEAKLNQIRIAILLGALLFSLFTFLDVWMLGEMHLYGWIIRLGIIDPILFGVFILTFTKHYESLIQKSMLFASTTAGLGIVLMTSLNNDIGSYLYGTGLMVVFMWVCVMSGMLFKFALVGTSTVMVAYNISLLNMTDYPFYVTLNNNFMIFSTMVIGLVGSYLIEKYIRRDFFNKRLLAEEKAKTEALLLNILPKTVVDELKENKGVIAKGYEQVGVAFADIVGFTEFSDKTSPTELVFHLNSIFSRLDTLCDWYGLEKIKTIGDAYMVASGLPESRPEHLKSLANMLLDMKPAIDLYNKDNQTQFEFRIGMHVGPTVAGVIGVKKFLYDIWGDTVNTASRMESSGEPGKIQVSQDVFAILKDEFAFQERGIIQIKGKGEMLVFYLNARKEQSTSSYKKNIYDDKRKDFNGRIKHYFS